jgi:hypothetical protein
MNDESIIELAEDFLSDRAIRFVKPGSVTRMPMNIAEVVFLIPESLDPNAVVDPPDVRVLVHPSGCCELVPQM